MAYLFCFARELSFYQRRMRGLEPHQQTKHGGYVDQRADQIVLPQRWRML